MPVFSFSFILKSASGQIKQAFLNLLKNAEEAIPDKGGKIVVSTKTVEGRVQVEIQDTGTGIQPENLTTIFDPFYTTKPSEGTGLGLSITKEIIGRHGGKIEVASEPEKGTVFTVTLPLKKAPQKPSPAVEI